MSADNGIYIAEFPNGEWRVAESGDSLISEIQDQYWFSEEEYRDIVMDIWAGSDVFTSHETAANYAADLAAKTYTEYGICSVEIPWNYGELPDKLADKPEIPEGCCPHCSSIYTHVRHGSIKGLAETDCSNPELPYNKIVAILRSEFKGVHEYSIARAVVELLYGEDKV